jgi:hypothetical protein
VSRLQPADQSAAHILLEPIMRLASEHAAGPGEYARQAVCELFERFLEVEELLCSNSPEVNTQDIIDQVPATQPSLYSSNREVTHFVN